MGIMGVRTGFHDKHLTCGKRPWSLTCLLVWCDLLYPNISALSWQVWWLVSNKQTSREVTELNWYPVNECQDNDNTWRTCRRDTFVRGYARFMSCTLPKKSDFSKPLISKTLLVFGHPRNTACGCVNYSRIIAINVSDWRLINEAHTIIS